MFVDFNILNQLGSPSINSNTFANRPAAGQTGRLFVSIDTFEIYRDNGTTWDLIGGPGTSTVTGTGAATQVAYWTAAQSIGGSNNLWWDNTNGFLGVGSAAPTARIEAVKTDGIGIFANYTTNAGSGSSATGIYAINNTASSGYAAVIEEKTGNTTGGQYPLLVKHSLSSGTAAVGMGTGLQFQLPDDAGTFKTTQLTIETIDAAAATYSTRYRFNVQSNGSSTPMAYLNATGLGIKTATPLGLIHADGGASAARIILDADSGVAKIFSFRTDALPRWAFRVDGAETGSNAGADFAIRAYDDAGAFTFAPLSIIRATGESTFSSTKTYSTGNAIGVAVQHNLTIPNGVNVGLAALGGVNSNLNLTLGGSTTVANTGRQGLEGSTSISFTGAGTLTMTQGSTVRAFSALSSVYAFNGSAVGTITHLAGLRICFPDNVGSAVNITNNYALLINNQTTGTGTVTYTNRWGIYQEGASDLNYFAANLLLGSTTNSGERLQVTGTASITTPNRTFRILTNAYSISDSTRSAGMGMDGAGLYFGNVAGNTGWNISSTQMTLDIAGNLGLGVTPSAWGSNSKPLQAADASFWGITSLDGYASIGGNYFYDGTYKYIKTGQATDYYQYQGEHVWRTAASGTAGNAITFTQAMTLNTSGNLGLGTTSPQTGGGAAKWITLDGSTYGGGLISSVSSVAKGYLYFDNSTGNFVMQAVTSVGVGLFTNNTERARITSGGNFLIGTTTDAGQKLQVNGSVSIPHSNLYRSGSNAIKSSDSITVSTSATTIFTSQQVGSVDSGNLVVVTGVKSGTGDNFCDLVLFMTNGSAVTVSSTVIGSPPARTYSVSGNNLQLTMASGTYVIGTGGFIQGYNLTF